MGVMHFSESAYAVKTVEEGLSKIRHNIWLIFHCFKFQESRDMRVEILSKYFADSEWNF